MGTKDEKIRMSVMGIATAVYETLGYTLPQLEEREPISGFTLRLERVVARNNDSWEAEFGMLVKDGFGEGYASDYEIPADFTFTCGGRPLTSELLNVSKTFVEHAEMVRFCYVDDDGWGEDLAHELVAAAAFLSLEGLWGEGAEVWAARGDEMAEHGDETIKEVARRASQLVKAA